MNGTMQFRCPFCGFNGGVRIPAHFPKGRTIRIRCSRCRKPFPLSLGRLFPQKQAESYRALVPGSLPCRGERIGRLWVESTGPSADRTPLIVLPAHPALSHEVMHDLMDPFQEYLRILYLEFPGSARNRDAEAVPGCGSSILDSLDALKKRFNASRFHLLAHLASCPLALKAAEARPQAFASLILIEPDMDLAGRIRNTGRNADLRRFLHGSYRERERAKLLYAIIKEVWDWRLEENHARGLARIMAPGFRPPALRHDILHCRYRVGYRKLSRQRIPMLIYYARDGGETTRRDVLYLQASTPGAETAALERGGAWAPWFGGTWFANKLLSFKRKADSRQGAVRRRTQTLNGQPLGWMLALFILLAGGLSAGSSLLRWQPDFMQRVIPPVLAGLLPILWFLIPKKVNPLAFLRFRAFSLPSTLLPLLLGALIGLYFQALTATLPALPLQWAILPGLGSDFLYSLLPEAEGRLYELAALGVLTLFVFGVAENLWILRRSPLQILVPTVLFALLPPAFPDVLWRLPAGFIAAVLFAASLSIYSVLFLLAGFAAVSQLAVPLELLPVSWPGYQGAAVTIAVLALALLITVLAVTKAKEVSAEELYLRRSINREGRLLRWATGPGIVIVVFSLIGAAALAFGFLAA